MEKEKINLLELLLIPLVCTAILAMWYADLLSKTKMLRWTC